MLKRSIRLNLILLFVVLSLTGVASAHAILVRTDPLDGATLATAPDHIRLWFSEGVALNFASFELVDGHGQHTALTQFALDAQDDAQIVIDVPSLRPDAYRLIWKAASSDDLHLSSGSIVFGVQQAADAASAPDNVAAPQPLEVILRWLNFGALATAIGALLVACVLLPQALASTLTLPDQLMAAAQHLRRKLWRLALVAANLTLIASAGLLFAQAATAGKLNVDNLRQILSQTSYGVDWLMRVGWLIVLIGVLAWRWRKALPEADRVTVISVVPLIMAVLIMQALASHAAAFTDATLIRVVVEVLHQLAASVWVGGLLVMALTLVPLLRHTPTEKALARSILQRFGVPAAISLGVLVITGIYSTGQQVASIDALLTTFYGQTLLLKIGLVISIGVLGLINSSLLHPRVADVLRRMLRRPLGWTLLNRQRVGRTVLMEALGAAAIVLLAAVLSAAQPARGPEFEAVSAVAAPSPITASVGDLLLSLAVKPDRPGQNFISIGVFNTRRPAPAPITTVTLRLTPPAGPRGPIALAAEPLGDGRYQVAGGVIDMAGDWQIALAIVRPGLPDVTWSTIWTVLPVINGSARPILISNQPLALPLTIAAVMLMLIGGALILGLGLRRRMRLTTGWRRVKEARVS